jgi:hypothetical protein
MRSLDIKILIRYAATRAMELRKGRSTNVMWTNAAFGMYMGRHAVMAADEFEPARRLAVQLGALEDAHSPEPVETAERSAARLGLATFAMSALTAGRRLVRG